MSWRVSLAFLASLLFTIAGRPWGHGLSAVFGVAVLSAALYGERSVLRGAFVSFAAWAGLALPFYESASLSIWWATPALLIVHGAAWFGLGAAYVGMSNKWSWAPMTFPVLITGVEYILGSRLLLGDIAMSLLGYTQADNQLRLLAAWSGVSGPTFGASLLGSALHWTYLRKWGRATAAVVGVAITLVIPTPGTMPQSTFSEVRVGVVQTAQGIIDRLLAGFDEELLSRGMNQFYLHTQEAYDAGADLVVWGETVLPEGGAGFPMAPQVTRALSAAPVVIAGAVEYAPNELYNSVFVWRGHGLELLARKQALVPIVEGVYSTGQPTDPVSIQGTRLAAFVCLDSFYGELSRESVLRGADLLLYLTDDTFAGVTATPYYHLNTAIIRAVETARSVVFANEAGPSALIAPAGAVLARSPFGESASIVHDLPLRTGITPYVALGDWLGLLCSVALVAALLLRLLSVAAVKLRSKRSITPQRGY